MNGIIVFQDVAGKKTQTVLNGLSSADASIMSKMLGFALSIQSYTNTAVLEYGVIRPNIEKNPALGTIAPSVDEYDSSLYKGLCVFDHVVDSENVSKVLWIPAPILAHYEHIAEVGYRMSPGGLNDLAAYFATATGIADLSGKVGKVEYRSGKSVQPNDGAFIQFKDFHGRSQYMGVPGVDDMTKLKAFADVLSVGANQYTNCIWEKVGIMTPEMERRAVSPTAETGYDSVDVKTITKHSWIDANNKRQSMQLTLPGVMESNLEPVGVDGRNRYLDQAVGEGIALALTALYGSSVRNLNFESGVCDIQEVKRS